MLRHLVPDERASSVLDIDPSALSARGIKGLILDLDDTLVHQFERTPTDAVRQWLTAARSHLSLIILSNNRRRTAVSGLAAEFGVPYVHLALKPLLLGFRRALRHIGLDAREVAVVGDQLFTDVLGGKRLGAHTILVQPVSGTERNSVRRLMRRAEMAVLARRTLRSSSGGA